MVAYGTYDLTNLTTLNEWPETVVVDDMAWGSVLSALMAAAVLRSCHAAVTPRRGVTPAGGAGPSGEGAKSESPLAPRFRVFRSPMDGARRRGAASPYLISFNSMTMG